MEGVRHTDLDGFCESIGEVREQANQCKLDENGYKQEALTTMRKRGVTQYRHAGVELIRRLGDEKLSVRLIKGGSEEADGDHEGVVAPPPDPDAGDVLDDFIDGNE